MNQKTAPGLFRRPLRARRTLAGAALAAALAAFSPGVAGAQTYPTRDVTLGAMLQAAPATWSPASSPSIWPSASARR